MMLSRGSLDRLPALKDPCGRTGGPKSLPKPSQTRGQAQLAVMTGAGATRSQGPAMWVGREKPLQAQQHPRGHAERTNTFPSSLTHVLPTPQGPS